jgi:hypothetical protein
MTLSHTTVRQKIEVTGSLPVCLLISPQLGCFQHLDLTLPRLVLVEHTSS